MCSDRSASPKSGPACSRMRASSSSGLMSWNILLMVSCEGLFSGSPGSSCESSSWKRLQ